MLDDFGGAPPRCDELTRRRPPIGAAKTKKRAWGRSMDYSETPKTSAAAKNRKRLTLRDARISPRPKGASNALDMDAQQRVARLASLLRGDQETQKQS